MASSDTRTQTNDANQALPNEPWYAITLTNYQRGKAREPFYEVASFLARSMSQLFAARPHWGKICPMNVAEIRELYPAFESFRLIRESFDPQHVFSNRWTEQLLDPCEQSVR
jgi:hypothetical protein